MALAIGCQTIAFWLMALAIGCQTIAFWLNSENRIIKVSRLE